MAHPIPDFDSSSEPVNIERIIDYLAKLEAVPMDAIDALQGLLARAEYVDVSGEDPDTVSVIMPTHQRLEHKRQVHLVDITFTCKVCGLTQTITTYPGRRPTVCQGEDGQRSECQRKANSQQMKMVRERKKQADL